MFICYTFNCKYLVFRETVTDTSKYVELQTEIILNEDLDTRKTEYSPAVNV